MTHLTRKVLTFLTAFAMVAGTAPIYGENVSAEEQSVTESSSETIITGTFGETGTYTYDTETYTLTLENEKTIKPSVASVDIPEYWNAVNLVIGEGVEGVYIKTNASNVYIPAGVTSIGGCTVQSNNHNLKNVYVDKNNKKYTDIDGVLFTKGKSTLLFYPYGRKQERYMIPEGTKIVNEGAFPSGYHEELKYLTLPASLEQFNSDFSLKYVYYDKYDDVVNNLHTGIFTLNVLNPELDLSHIYAGNGISNIRGYAGSTAESFAEKYGDNATFEEISSTEYANGVISGNFSETGTFTYDILNKNLTIGNQPSITADNLDEIAWIKDTETIYISDVQEFSEKAFNPTRFPYLKSFCVSDGTQGLASVDGVLFTKDMKRLLCYPLGKIDTEYIIPEGVETFDDGNFTNNTFIESLTLPESMNLVYGASFYNCDNLKYLTVLNPNLELAYCGFGLHSHYGLIYGNGIITISAYEGSLAFEYDPGYYFTGRIILDVLERDYIPGDLDENGETSITDMIAMKNLLLSDETFLKIADMNYDGKVNIKDFILFKQALIAE